MGKKDIFYTPESNNESLPADDCSELRMAIIKTAALDLVKAILDENHVKHRKFYLDPPKDDEGKIIECKIYKLPESYKKDLWTKFKSYINN